MWDAGWHCSQKHLIIAPRPRLCHLATAGRSDSAACATQAHGGCASFGAGGAGAAQGQQDAGVCSGLGADAPSRDDPGQRDWQGARGKPAAGPRRSGCKKTLQTYTQKNKNELLQTLAEMRLEAYGAVKRGPAESF